jgi:hypothetical protein
VALLRLVQQLVVVLLYQLALLAPFQTLVILDYLVAVVVYLVADQLVHYFVAALAALAAVAALVESRFFHFSLVCSADRFFVG